MYNRNIFHGALEKCFVGERQHPLWRIDHDSDKTCMIILSKNLPDFEEFQEQFGLAGTQAETKSYDKHVESITDRELYRFRLVANPVITKEGKRIPLNMNSTEKYPYSADDWLRDRLKAAGAEAVFVEISNVNSNKITKDRQRITISTMQFDGVLNVFDANALKKALINGIGHGKAYGSGLLTIMR